MRRYPAIFVLLLLAGGISVASSAPPASPQPLDELRRLVRDAATAGQKRVVIPPGIYRGEPEKGGKIHLALRKVSDMEIVADGVTMLCTRPSRAIDLSDCSNVTLSGLTIDYDPLPFTQGDIIAVNGPEGWMDVKIHAGYPVEPHTRIDIVDRTTRYRKDGKPFMWDSKAEVRDGGVVRVLSKSAAGFAKVGDLASLGGSFSDLLVHTLVVTNSSRITLRNVTVHASNCMGIILSGGEGDHRLLGCRVIPGPPPAGATESRILSTNADAILTGPMRKGVLTEGCEIRDAGDDSWSVQSADYVILQREGRSLWLAWRGSLALATGDRLQASLDGPIATATACQTMKTRDAGLSPEIQQKVSKAPGWSYWHLGGGHADGWVCKVTLDADVPWKEGDSIYDIDRQGNGFVFRNNTIRSSGRVLIKASGLVEGNRIEGPFGLSVNPEVPCPAAAGIAEIVIRNNTIVDAHRFNGFYHSPQAGAISVTAENGGAKTLRPPGIFGKVLIENNTIQGGNGAGIVVSSARDLILRGNRLIDPLHIKPNETGAKYTIDNHAAVWIAQCDRVLLDGNEIRNPGPFISRPFVFGPGVANITGSDAPR